MHTRIVPAVCLSICVFWCLIPLSRAQYCDFPPKQLTQGEHREYRGHYDNRAFGYSVVIPANLVGYDDANPFYQHGFGIIVGTEQPSYILVNGEPNSLEFARPSDAASQTLQYLGEHQNTVESSKITNVLLDQRNAALLIATYACRGSTEKYVMSSMVAISPDKGQLYEVTLYSHAGRFEKDRTIFDAMTRSWKYLPQNPGESTSAKSLPEGALKALAPDVKEYCEEQFEEAFRKGCEKKFGAHLRWHELSITPSGQTAVLVENNNVGFCGSGGCALYLLVRQTGTKFTQVLGSYGGMGTLERVTVLKKITKGHFDIRVTWSGRRGDSVYQWDGSQYSE